MNALPYTTLQDRPCTQEGPHLYNKDVGLTSFPLNIH